MTHDQEEAFAVCDHIGVSKEGHLNSGTPPQPLPRAALTPLSPASSARASFAASCSAPIRCRPNRRDPRQSRQPAFRQRGRRPAAPGRSGTRRRASWKARIVGKHLPGAATLYRLQLPTGTQLESIFPAMPTTSRAMTSVSASPPTTWWCSPPGQRRRAPRSRPGLIPRRCPVGGAFPVDRIGADVSSPYTARRFE